MYGEMGSKSNTIIVTEKIANTQHLLEMVSASLNQRDNTETTNDSVKL